MNSIKKKLIKLINSKEEGIALDQFINICLYKKDGYYVNKLPLGKYGDFVTAPEISTLSFFSKSSTPFNPTRSNLSIALITFNS